MTRRRRTMMWIVAIVAVLLTNACVTSRLADRANRKQLKNPETGICIGAEERTLGPEDAECAVLMVHGFVGGTNNFETLPDRLADLGFRVRVMRLPGHGTHPRDYAAETPESLLNAVVTELKALKANHKRVALVGHSMGGTLCTLAVAQEGADALVLGAPYFGVTYHWYYGLRAETWTKILRPVVPWLYKGQLFKQVNRQDVKQDIFSYIWIPTQGIVTLQSLGRQAWDTEAMSKVTCPVLWIHSVNDAAASYNAASRAFALFPNEQNQSLRLTKSNHHVFWDYEREEVDNTVETFLVEHLK